MDTCICRAGFEANQESRNSFRYNFSLGDLQIKMEWDCVRIHNASLKIDENMKEGVHTSARRPGLY